MRLLIAHFAYKRAITPVNPYAPLFDGVLDL